MKMDPYIDHYISENAILKRKLQSKAEALLILSQELEECRVQRDQFKMMAEQVQDRYIKLKKMSPDFLNYEGGNSSRLPLGGRTVSQVFEDLREQNKGLQLEVEDLKQKLKETQGDMKALRAGMHQQRDNGDCKMVPDHQREELVQQLEGISAHCAQLKSDMQALLDENEELVMERDSYKCKIHRMNHQLGVLLRANPSQLFDVDAIISENKYLHERVDYLKEEIEFSRQSVLKYKGMLDKKRNKGSVKLGTNNNSSDSSGMVISHKQVQQLLENGSPSQLPNTEATLADMKSLCLALLEALQDKSLALTHQRKSNKILANRVNDLEQRISSIPNGVPVYPSEVLLNGYTTSNVDKDLALLHDFETSSSSSDTNQISRVSDQEDHENCKNNSDNFHVGKVSKKLADETINIQYREQNEMSNIQTKITSIATDCKLADKLNSFIELSPESEELSMDLLPPQLQELVLNALKDIEDTSNVNL